MSDRALTTLVATPRRLHRIEHIMGMPIIIDVHDEGVSESALDRAFDWLRRIDAMFSTYRPDSEISRLNTGELTLDGCSPLVRRTLDRCHALREVTAGYFDHEAAARWDPRIAGAGPAGPPPVDPSGLVKGWAVDGVAEILEQAGARNYCAEAAGDMRLAGHPHGDTHWRIGIQHPMVGDAVAAVLRPEGRAAIATSATYARGDHIVDPHTGTAARDLASVTIVGPGDLATADVYATAVFAMGRAGAGWAARTIDPYDALVIGTDGIVLATAGLRDWRA
jgi:thiamine biosynthesis lipoprotein